MIKDMARDGRITDFIYYDQLGFPYVLKTESARAFCFSHIHDPHKIYHLTEADGIAIVHGKAPAQGQQGQCSHRYPANSVPSAGLSGFYTGTNSMAGLYEVKYYFELGKLVK